MKKILTTLFVLVALTATAQAAEVKGRREPGHRK